MGVRISMTSTCYPVDSPAFKKALDRADKHESQASLQLPLWYENECGVPNLILQTSLFSATSRTKRKFLQRAVIGSFKSVNVIYTGANLDQSDLDVWLGVLQLAKNHNHLLGDRIEFTERNFLRLINRASGKSDRTWLKNVFRRLSATNLEVCAEIKNRQLEYGGSLVHEYYRDDDSELYVLVLNQKIKILFDNNAWTKLDLKVRYALRGNPLAQWLHGFYSTLAQPFKLKVETLHRYCGSNAGLDSTNESERQKAILGWRDDTLKPALTKLENALQSAGFAFNWQISSSDLIEVNREPTKTQKRFLKSKEKFNHLST